MIALSDLRLNADSEQSVAGRDTRLPRAPARLRAISAPARRMGQGLHSGGREASNALGHQFGNFLTDAAMAQRGDIPLPRGRVLSGISAAFEIEQALGVPCAQEFADQERIALAVPGT